MFLASLICLYSSAAPEDDSPYPEVRSAVANTDDTEIPVNTLRAWVIGIIGAIIIPGMNQFFFFRFPSVTVGPVCRSRNSSFSILSKRFGYLQIVAQLIAFPVGRAWAHLMPRKRLFGIALNPGPFTIKEHVLVTIMASVGYQSAYAVSIYAITLLSCE